MKRKKQTKKIKNRRYEKLFESDGEFLVKLMLCILLATFWIKLKQPMVWGELPVNAIPLGLLVGLLIVYKLERFQSDRKIWYVVLILVGILTYFYPSGIVV